MRDSAAQASPAAAPAATQKWIVCRVCLQQPKEPMASIFHDDAEKDLTNMIRECGGVPIKQFDHYPDKICEKCFRVLKMAFKFRETCQRSYGHLRQFVGPVEVEQRTPEKKSEEQAPKLEQESEETEQEQEHEEEEEEEDLDESQYTEAEADESAEAQGGVFNDELEEGILVELEKDRIVHVKSEQVEEDGIIEEVYDVYETYEGDIITEQGTYDQEVADQSLSELSADIEYLDQVDQDQLTESAHEDEVEGDMNSTEEEFVPTKSILASLNARGGNKRRANPRRAAASASSAPVPAASGTGSSKTAARGNPLKVRRGNSNAAATKIVINSEEGVSIGEVLARKHAGIKTKGGHKILVGDKKEFKYICDVCGNMYPSQSRLTEHIKVHSGVKPHECEICGHCFAQAQQLARHMNTHTGNRPYKCSYCPAAFADLSTRNKHHRIHTNERPYECDVCHKTFTYTNTLKFHKMIHTGEKPHVCEVCGKGFPQAYKLRNHRIIHERRGQSARESVSGLMPYDTANIVGLEI
ncbi:zinc finger protein with KRAB and SCAN domains 1 [Drosophila elegans]|uniref:zinc finger protein with KRAB and SCAN domains 1 n=1 Tax=Drosophila elegans TaxID=30023 RepID=UPI0007E7386C|nr:zinc finger protein with KRAB and SCAN domains 1 [Drosophila elegans]